MTRRLTQEEFLERLEVIFKDINYKFSNTKYVRHLDDVEFTCTLHGIKKIRAVNLLQGKGCNECAAINRPKNKVAGAARKFKDEASLKHNNLYTYDNAVYKGARVKLSVTCTEHGDFDVTPNNHLRGRGCPSCKKTGFHFDKPGILYVLICDSLTKIGITNARLKERISRISESYEKPFTLHYSISSEDGTLINDVETILLRELRKDHAQPKEQFLGYTECFYDVDHTKLVARIQELICNNQEQLLLAA